MRMLLCLLLPGALLATDTQSVLDQTLDWSQEQQEPGSQPPAVGGALATAIGIAIALGGMGLGLAWWAKQKGWLPSPTAATRSGLLQIEDQLPLGLKRSLLLVQCGEHRVLIGQTESSLHALATFPAATPPPTMPAEDQPPTAEDFKARLQALRTEPQG
jgi:flagellar biogenesis protein FliO